MRRHGSTNSFPGHSTHPTPWALKSPAPQLNPQRTLLGDVLGTLAARVATEQLRELPAEVDVVVSGGGLRGYYVTGCWVVLRSLVRAGRLRIRRFAGASAGAWCCVFMACDMEPLDWVETYFETARHSVYAGKQR